MCAFVRVRAQAFSDRRAVDFSLVSPAAEIRHGGLYVLLLFLIFYLFFDILSDQLSPNLAD